MNMNNEISAEYRQYLNSDKWKAIRDNIVYRDGNMCRLCGSQERLEVHHMNGKFRFKEEYHPEILITLCADCHERIHLYWHVCDSVNGKIYSIASGI